MIHHQFPLLPDEHLYSWLVRLYWLSGYPSFSTFQHSLGFQSRFLKSQPVFDNTLTKAALLTITEKNPLRLLLRHSTLATWLISLPPLLKPNTEKLERLLNTHSHMNEQLMFSFDTTWQSCPACREKDLSHYGSSYWHVSHQLPSITHCRMHGERLEVALEPVKNLYQEKLPHHVQNWRQSAREDCQSIDIWEQFVIQTNDRCINDLRYGPMLRKKIEQYIGAVGKNKAQKKRKCNELTPEFEAAVGDSVLRHLFRSHAKSGKLAKLNVLNTLFASQKQPKGIRNPIFWLVLAFWLRNELQGL